jgi:hypothetical protein
MRILVWLCYFLEWLKYETMTESYSCYCSDYFFFDEETGNFHNI